jgi:UDP-hydrolysing UDP-N-acetyl-D-glucosamine 2-epimerase
MYKKQDVKRICVVLVDRANYGRMHPVMRAINSTPDLELLTVCAGTMLLERFGKAENIVAADGFDIHGRVYMELEGSVPATMAKSIGLGIIELSTEFQRLKPDLVLLIGDRYEALAAAISAAYMNIPVAHIQGGEVSGSIDESARHAITKFAHLHFPSTERAADYIIKLGEITECVFNVGCPAGDYILQLDSDLPEYAFSQIGIGANIDPSQPFILVIYHPVTTRFGNERQHAEQLLMALHELAHPTVWIWPNIDAGADEISKCLRSYREKHSSSGEWLHLIKNLDPVTFQKCLKRAACAVGNSSSFIRDSTFSGTPVVLVGDRQVGREHGDNLVAVSPVSMDIANAVRSQLQHGRYAPSTLYGNGTASVQIVEKIKMFVPYRQKMLQYVFDHERSDS